MQYALFAAQVMCLTLIVRRRMPLPLFAASLLLSLPLVATYDPGSMTWINRQYSNLAPLVILLRVGAAIEIGAEVLLPPHRHRWLALLASAAVPVSMLAMAWDILGHPALNVVLTRRFAHIFAAIFLLLVTMYLWRSSGLIGWYWGWRQRHLAILLLILWNHAAVALYGLHVVRWGWLAWYTAQPVSWGIAAVLYWTWAASIWMIPSGRRLRRVATGEVCE